MNPIRAAARAVEQVLDALHRCVLPDELAEHLELVAVEPASGEDAAEKARRAPGFDALLDRALGCGDEHAIKLVEACAREHVVAHDAAYVAAALEGVERFESASATR